MAAVGFVNAQINGSTVRFEIVQSSSFLLGRGISAYFGSSAYDVLNRLQNGYTFGSGVLGASQPFDVYRVLSLSWGGEMNPAKNVAMPWGSDLKNGGAYVSLAVLILKAYLFGIDSSAATWAPAS